MEKISVLLSVYKDDNNIYLRESLDSVIKQTLNPNEIVLVEDGPLTKELYETINEFKSKYPSLIKTVVNEENIGLGLSLKKGLEKCSNELVARMDSDDISIKQRFELQVREFEKDQQISICGGQIEEFIEDVNSIVGKRKVPIRDKDIKEYIKRRCPMNHVTVMFKKSSVINAGGYRHWPYNEDYDLWIRMTKDDQKFVNLNESLVYVRVGKEMYRRRGGWKYFNSELKIQLFMLKSKIISIPLFTVNILKRIILQILLPNRLRGWVYQKFARS